MPANDEERVTHRDDIIIIVAEHMITATTRGWSRTECDDDECRRDRAAIIIMDDMDVGSIKRCAFFLSEFALPGSCVEAVELSNSYLHSSSREK